MLSKTNLLFNEIHTLEKQLRALQNRPHDPANAPAIQAAYESLGLALESLYVTEAELHQQQEVLIESQGQIEAERRRYFNLFEYAPDAYLVTDPRGVILEANRAAATLFNLTQHYLIGKPLALYVTRAERRDFRSFLFSMSYAMLNKLHTQEIGIQSHRMALPTIVSATVIPAQREAGTDPTLRWSFRAITRRRQAERQLYNTNRLLTSLIAASPFAIVAVNTEGNVQLWNQAARQITGWSHTETLGHSPPHVPPHLLEEYHQRLAHSLKGQSHHEIETLRMRKDGRYFPIRLSVTPLYNTEGTIVGSMSVFADISTEVETRAQLQRDKAQLRNIRLEEQRRLARDLHDGAVQQLVGLQFHLAYQRRVATAGATMAPEFTHLPEGLSAIESEIKGVIQLLRGVISDLRPPGLEEYGLCRALEGYVTKLQRQAPPTAPLLGIKCPPHDPPLSLALATTLFRATQEAIFNAYRHATARHIIVTLSEDGSTFTIEVRDDGAGFNVPTRLSTLVQENHFGLMGLAEEIEVVGGTLDIISSAEGTILTITAPLTSGDDQ